MGYGGTISWSPHGEHDYFTLPFAFISEEEDMPSAAENEKVGT
jgi:hypothetical protein